MLQILIWLVLCHQLHVTEAFCSLLLFQRTDTIIISHNKDDPHHRVFPCASSSLKTNLLPDHLRFGPVDSANCPTANGRHQRASSLWTIKAQQTEDIEDVAPSTDPLDVVLLLPSLSTFDNDALDDELERFAHSLIEELNARGLHSSMIRCYPSQDDATTSEFLCQEAPLVLALGIELPGDIRYVATLFRQRRAASIGQKSQFALDRSKTLSSFAPLVRRYDEANPTWQAQWLPWSPQAQHKALMFKMQELFVQGTLDNYVQAVQLYFQKGDNQQKE